MMPVRYEVAADLQEEVVDAGDVDDESVAETATKRGEVALKVRKGNTWREELLSMNDLEAGTEMTWETDVHSWYDFVARESFDADTVVVASQSEMESVAERDEGDALMFPLPSKKDSMMRWQEEEEEDASYQIQHSLIRQEKLDSRFQPIH